MSIMDLMRIIPPPASPNENHISDWGLYEKILGFSIPEDYKDFICCFGSGQINNYLYILNPVSHNKNINLMDWVEEIKEANKLSIRYFGEPCYPFIFSEKDRTIPWGYTDNGDEFYWLLDESKEPMLWPCIVYEPRSGEKEIISTSMSSLLLALLTNKTTINIINLEPFHETPSFTVF